MISLIAQLATLAVAILGLFFSKSGEKNRINRVGIVILLLIIIAGTRLAVANNEIARLQNSLILMSLKDINKFTQMRIIFDGQQFADEIDGYLGPIPIKLPGVTHVKFTFGIRDIFKMEVEFENIDGKLSGYEIIGGKRKVFPITCEPSGQNSCSMTKLTDHWVTDALNGIRSHVVFLPIDNSLVKPGGHKVLSSLIESFSLGQIEITHPTGAFDPQGYADKISKSFEIIVKVYGSRSNEQRCTALITVPVAIRTSAHTEGESTFQLYAWGNLQYDSCEIPPL